MSYNHDWKTSMDALVELTSKAWFGPRESDKPRGLNASLSLAPKPKLEKEDEETEA